MPKPSALPRGEQKTAHPPCKSCRFRGHTRRPHRRQATWSWRLHMAGGCERWAACGRRLCAATPRMIGRVRLEAMRDWSLCTVSKFGCWRSIISAGRGVNKMELVNDSFTSSYSDRLIVHSLQSRINSTLAQVPRCPRQADCGAYLATRQARGLQRPGVDRARSTPPARRAQGPRRPGISQARRTSRSSPGQNSRHSG